MNKNETLGGYSVFTKLVPYVFNLLPPINGFNNGEVNAYDIIKVKEFLRRRKMAEKFTQRTINSDFFSSIRNTDDEIIMDVNMAPKAAIEHVKMNISISPTTGVEFKL